METLLQDCQRLTNVTIQCQDGLVSSHKLVLAGVSDFIKNILSEIPVGDEVTLLMPDFRAEEVEKFLFAFLKDTYNEKDIDMLTAFGRETQTLLIPVNCEYTHQDNIETGIILKEDLKIECDPIEDKQEYEADEDFTVEQNYVSPMKKKKFEQAIKAFSFFLAIAFLTSSVILKTP